MPRMGVNMSINANAAIFLQPEQCASMCTPDQLDDNQAYIPVQINAAPNMFPQSNTEYNNNTVDSYTKRMCP